MSSIYQNPENGLKRAETLYELGKQDEAMYCLYDVLKNRKHRLLKHTHEAVINKLLEICVERKLSGFAKDGLYLYRIICQGVNIKSWEDAVKKLLLFSESKIETTVKDLQSSFVDFRFLDQTVTPESLLKISSSDEIEIRSKQISLLSWIKFKWECYRICMELLRNTQFEKFYHYIIQSAFKFCLKYSRKTEFRKLCNSLKMHVNYLQKRHTGIFKDDKNCEITTLYLETGITELKTALELELWQDALRIAEDIHSLMSIVKQTINSKVMAAYYENLSILFWEGNDLLFHAAALFRYFLFSKEVKKAFNSEAPALSSRVVLAVLSIPFDSDKVVDSITESNSTLTEKNQRLMASLLNFSNIPTRKLLIKNLNIHYILQSSHPEIQYLFNLLENEVDPLNLNARLEKLTNAISELDGQITSKQYFPSLFAVSTIRLLSQLSRIYETITLSKFFSLVPFVEPSFIERFVVDSGRRYNIPVSIDQANRCLRFRNRFCLFESKSTIDGPETHQLPDNQNLNCLSNILNSLKKIKNLITPESEFESSAHVLHLQEQYFKSQNMDRMRILERKKLIEKHKEMLENLQIRKEEAERKRLAQEQSKQEAAERQKLRKEAEERAIQRRILEEQKIKNQILLEKIENFKKSELGQTIEKLERNKLSSVDPDSLLSKHIEYVQREKKEFQTRLRKQERTVNHMERAKRIEEIPLLKQEYEIAKMKALETWEKDEKCRIQRINEERSCIIADKNRMLVIQDDLNAFMQKISIRRKLEHENDCLNFLKTIEKEREKCLLERTTQRKAERRRKWLEEKKKSENDNDAHFKLVRRRETRNNTKTIREKSAEKSREFRIEQDYLIPKKPHQEKVKTSDQESTQSSPTRYNNENKLDNQPRRHVYDIQTKNSMKRDESPYKSTQPKYHILKRNESAFFDKIIPNEHFLPSWCKSSDLRKDDTDFRKPFLRCSDNPKAKSPKKQSSNSESTTFKLEPASRYKYLQKHCQPECLQREDILSDSPLYKKNVNSEFHLNSTGKILKRGDEKDRPNIGGKIKYDVGHSCTPWAKLNRNNTKPNN